MLLKEVTHDSAIRTLNEDLLPAMKEVGDKFGSGELILTFCSKICRMYEGFSWRTREISSQRRGNK